VLVSAATGDRTSAFFPSTAAIIAGIVQGTTAGDGEIVGTENPTVFGPIVAGTGSIVTRNLTALTLRGAGGPGMGGGAIDLNNAVDGLGNPQNSATGINLFACAIDGCPSLAGPFATVPYINGIAATPPLLYGDGPIFYTDRNGTEIAGIGTVNDFTYFNPGPGVTTVDGTTLFGKNITIEAVGNIDIKLSSPVTNASISPGGTIKFMSTGTINYDATVAGATFGRPSATFDRNLQFIAADDINLNSAIYLGGTGSLTLNANQSITFTSPDALLFFGGPGPHALPSGNGNVTMQGNNEIRVGGNLTVNAVDLTIKGGQLATPSLEQNSTGQLLLVGNTLNLNLTGNVSLLAGNSTGGPGLVSAGAVVVRGGTVVPGGGINVGGTGALGTAGGPVQNLIIKGGMGLAGAGAPNATMSATGDVKLFVAPTGDVLFEGGQGSAAILEGANINVGDVNAPGIRANSFSLIGGTAIPGVTQADSRVTATQTLNVLVTGNVDLTGKPGSGALMQGAAVNIGGAGLPVQNLTLAAGEAGGGRASDVKITATTGAASLFVSGDVDIAGGLGGSAVLQGVDVNVGAAGASVQNLSLTGGNASSGFGADAGIVAGQTATAFVSNNVGLTGGLLSSALVTGQNVNFTIGHDLDLQAGSGPVAGTLVGHQSDASVIATGALNVSVGGDLGLTGGATNILAGANPVTTATALAKLQGTDVLLNIQGNLTMTGGEAQAKAGGNTADSSVAIVATADLNPNSRIVGDFTIQGGTATAIPAGGQTANAQSTAKLETAGDMNLDVSGNLKIVGGTATADDNAGGNATASATASLNAAGKKQIVVGRDFVVNGGSATATGPTAVATALAGTDAGTAGFNGTLDIKTGGNMFVTGGPESGAGVASAAILAGGEIKVDVLGSLGLTLSGGGGTNFFQLIGSQLIEVEGKGYPITIKGLITLVDNLPLGDAFFISGAAPLTLTDPQLLRSLDCIAISGGSCVIPASGSRAGDPSRQVAGGTCK
jgi:hypothetical protein